ncbi:YheC/D-like protein [Aneurinibacillus soli]|uniref:Endospore coat-associated protein YheD n=1 Tax=Aneurinibacillus soli TaxID=1500254 RepID=A0A0U5B8H3_9BACL|nr:YheC/YheD family protein [Aneurinibacillus soli]PYE61309.1 YheC/D-like protein [Aneurinibacillus soli]BAU27862.1 Endospore coat-associated protein YheD [Aneurinibacillus soli]
MEPYKITVDKQRKQSIAVHPKVTDHLPATPIQQLPLYFGSTNKEVHLSTNDQLDQNEIHISEDILTALRIPLSPLYHIRYDNSQFHLGPFIGILVSSSHEFLRERVHFLDSFIVDYPSIGGAILTFSLEGVNPDDLSIHGFMYNPKNHQWIEGTYSYPSAMFSILEVSLTDKWQEFQYITKHFSTHLQGNIYNYPNFGKWEMHQWLQTTPKVEPYLPETTLYKDPEDLYEMLKNHQHVYVKPTLGRLGQGVVTCSLHHYGVSVRFQDHHGNHRLVLSTPPEFYSFFKKRLSPEEYIIQQSLSLLSTDQRIVDFRLMLVKDQCGKWSNTGLFSRYGAKNSIVSNITAGGYARWGQDTLVDLLDSSYEEAQKWEEQMTGIAVDAAEVMESYGIHAGNLGFDLAIDQNRKLWLLEINNQNPDHYIALAAGQEDALVRARRYNLLYCKYLAGFTESS